MNKQRMLKLADFLDNLPPKKFDFGSFRGEGAASCGTIGCAIGWMPSVFPRVCKSWVGEKVEGGYTLSDDVQLYEFDEAAEVLDIDVDHCRDLFTPTENLTELKPQFLPVSATPKQVAKRIRQFVEKYPASKFTG